MQVQRRRDQARLEEVGHRALEGNREVLGLVGVAGAVQDDGRASLGRLTPHVEDEVRVLVRAELAAEYVDATVAARRRRRAGAECPDRAEPADYRQRGRGGQDPALDGHSGSPSRRPAAVPRAPQLSRPDQGRGS